MCQCITGWTRDEAVDSAHNLQPMRCADYIAALEDLVLSLDPTADRGRLAVLRAAYGRETKSPVPDEPTRGLGTKNAGGWVT